jgi:hypothetical protein
MRAIKIDVIKKDVYEVEITPDIKTFYKHLECDCFCQVGRRMKNNDILIVDDEGLLKSAIGAFKFDTYFQPLSGHGLIYGTSGSGETIPAKSSIDDIKSKVTFMGTNGLPEPKIEVRSFDSFEDALKHMGL